MGDYNAAGAGVVRPSGEGGVPAQKAQVGNLGGRSARIGSEESFFFPNALILAKEIQSSRGMEEAIRSLTALKQILTEEELAKMTDEQLMQLKQSIDTAIVAFSVLLEANPSLEEHLETLTQLSREIGTTLGVPEGPEQLEEPVPDLQTGADEDASREVEGHPPEHRGSVSLGQPPELIETGFEGQASPQPLFEEEREGPLEEPFQPAVEGWEPQPGEAGIKELLQLHRISLGVSQEDLKKLDNKERRLFRRCLRAFQSGSFNVRADAAIVKTIVTKLKAGGPVGSRSPLARLAHRIGVAFHLRVSTSSLMRQINAVRERQNTLGFLVETLNKLSNFSSLSPDARIQLCKDYKHALAQPGVAKLLKNDPELQVINKQIQGLISTNPRAAAIMEQLSGPAEWRVSLGRQDVLSQASLFQRYPELMDYNVTDPSGRAAFKAWAKANMTSNDIAFLGRVEILDLADQPYPELDSVCKELALEDDLERKGGEQVSVDIVGDKIYIEVSKLNIEMPEIDGARCLTEGDQQKLTLAYKPATWFMEIDDDGIASLSSTPSNLGGFLKVLGTKVQLEPGLEQRSLEKKRESANAAVRQFLERWDELLRFKDEGTDVSGFLGGMENIALAITAEAVGYEGLVDVLVPATKARLQAIANARKLRDTIVAETSSQPLASAPRSRGPKRADQRTLEERAEDVALLSPGEPIDIEILFKKYEDYDLKELATFDPSSENLTNPEDLKAFLRTLSFEEIKIFGTAQILGKDSSLGFSRACKEVYLEETLKRDGFAGAKVTIAPDKSVSLKFDPALTGETKKRFVSIWQDHIERTGQADKKPEKGFRFDSAGGSDFLVTYDEFSPVDKAYFKAFMGTLDVIDAEVESLFQIRKTQVT